MEIEKILGTSRYGSETWEDVFKRINVEGGMDLKTISRVVAYLLDNFYKNGKKTVR